MKLALIAAATALTTNTAAAQMAKGADYKAPEQTIVQVATNAGFNTLVTAVKAAGLVDALSGTGPFTVFAPTDAAFAKLPAGTVEALLKDPQKLAAILKYHVVAGKVMAADVIKAKEAKPATLQGAALDIKVMGNMVHVNNAMVTQADVAASNGVIHVIDTVVLPPAGK
ncbi:MAG: fasciclin domain-containing protein [Gemmatimonadetes bacterium]|nr:fasciclin domain-containing protein [Gemmatimonadota bacterium]